MWMVYRYKDKGQVKALKLDGYSPKDLSHLLSGKYPLYRVYNLTTWERDGVSKPLARELVRYLLKQAEHLDSKFGVIPASRLRKAGWIFKGDELVGEPRG
jgi:hypothetical protein